MKTNISSVHAILLSGGDSDRFWPLGDKQLVAINNISPISRSIGQLISFGLKKITIISNIKNEIQIKKECEKYKNINIRIINQTDKRGMGGAVLSAKGHIDNEPILIISPTDYFEDILISKLIKITGMNIDGVFAGIKVADYFPGGYLVIKDELVMKIVEKPLITDRPSEYVKIVFDYYQNGQDLVKSLMKNSTKRDDFYEIAVNELIADGCKIKLLPYSGFWGYLKYPWHVFGIMNYYLSLLNNKQIQKSVKISKTAIISGNVIIEDQVVVMDNAYIKGPCIIGSGTVIGNNSLVRDSIIGRNCVVGFSTEITRSCIFQNCWFHQNYVGDSVIGENVMMGAGGILANYKLNQKSIHSFIKNEKINTGKIKLGSIIGSNTRIGVNTSIMPGIKIGANCMIGSSLCVYSDVKDNTKVILKQEHQVTSV